MAAAAPTGSQSAQDYHLLPSGALVSAPSPQHRRQLFNAAVFEMLNDADYVFYCGLSCSGKVMPWKVTAGAVSAVAKIFYWPINLKIPDVGVLFGMGNSAGFFALEYFSVSGTIDDVLAAGPHEKMLIAKNTLRGCKKAGVFTGIVILAAGSQAAGGIAAYLYNSPQWRVVACIFTIAAGMLYPIRSLQLSAEKALAERNLNDIQTKLVAMRDETVSLIFANQSIFTEQTTAVQLGMIAAFSRVKSLRASQDKINQCFMVMLHYKPTVDVDNPSPWNRRNVLVKAGTAVLGGSLLWALGQYTWDKTGNATPWTGLNYVISGACAGVSVLSNAYLSLDYIHSTVDGVYGWLTGNRKRTLCERLDPRLTFGLKVLATATTAFALGASYIIWSEYYEQNEAEEAYFDSTILMAFFLQILKASQALAENFVEDRIIEKGPANKKAMVLFKRSYDNLARLVKRSPLVDYAIAIVGLPEDMAFKATLLRKFEVTQAQLHQEINRDPNARLLLNSPALSLQNVLVNVPNPNNEPLLNSADGKSEDS